MSDPISKEDLQKAMDYQRRLSDQRHSTIEKTVEKLTESVDKMSDNVAKFMEMTIKATERDKAFYQTQQEHRNMIDKLNEAVLEIGTNTIPELQRSVALNSFSLKTYLSIAGIMATALGGVGGIIIYFHDKAVAATNSEIILVLEKIAG